MNPNEPDDWLKRMEEALDTPRDAEKPHPAPPPKPSPAQAAPPAGVVPQWWASPNTAVKAEPEQRELINKLNSLSDERQQSNEEIEKLRSENASLRETISSIQTQLLQLKVKALAAQEGYETKIRALQEQRDLMVKRVEVLEGMMHKLIDALREKKS